MRWTLLAYGSSIGESSRSNQCYSSELKPRPNPKRKGPESHISDFEGAYGILLVFGPFAGERFESDGSGWKNHKGRQSAQLACLSEEGVLRDQLAAR